MRLRLIQIILTSIFWVIAGIGCSSLLYHPTDILYVDPSKINATPEEHQFTLPDGVEIKGWYFRAKTPESRAVILFFHGNGQNRSSHYLSLYWLVEKGYDLAIFDYPGYGLSDGSATPSNTIEVGKKAIEYIHHLKPDLPLVVYGQSLGGVVAMRSIIELNGQIKPRLLVVDSSFLSYRKAARSILASSRWTWLLQPLSWFMFSDTWAVEDRLSRLQDLPIIVIHSRQDQVIPFKLGEEVYTAANSPKEFWIKEVGQHIQTYSGTEGEGLKEKLLHALP